MRRPRRPQLWLPSRRRRHPALEELARGGRRYGVGRAQPLAARTALLRRLLPRPPRLPWLRIVLVSLAIALPAGGGYGTYTLLSSDALRVRHAEVSGAELAGAHEIVAAADLGGRSLLALDANAAAAQVVAALPEVQAASVRRAWPQGVVIEVVEHQGWGYWQAAGRRVVIDAEGLVLERGRPPAADAVTIFEVDATLPPRHGQVMDTDTVQVVARLVADARSQRLGIDIGRFEFRRDRGLAVRVEEGPDAVFGDSHNYDFKVAAWGALLDRIEHERLEVREIDLRFGRQLVMR
jgi:hypothetical protein